MGQRHNGVRTVDTGMPTYKEINDSREEYLYILFFKKKWATPGLFLFILVFSIQLKINKCPNKFCPWLESNCGPQVLEATALPTEPQPLPLYSILSDIDQILGKNSTDCMAHQFIRGWTFDVARTSCRRLRPCCGKVIQSWGRGGDQILFCQNVYGYFSIMAKIASFRWNPL